MNFDGLTDRLRSRFFGRTSAHEEVEGQHNRASLRAGGLQGSMGSITYKDGKVQGRARGKFLGPMGVHAILISNAPGWQERLFSRIDRQSARIRRMVRRERAL